MCQKPCWVSGNERQKGTILVLWHSGSDKVMQSCLWELEKAFQYFQEYWGHGTGNLGGAERSKVVPSFEGGALPGQTVSLRGLGHQAKAFTCWRAGLCLSLSIPPASNRPSLSLYYNLSTVCYNYLRNCLSSPLQQDLFVLYCVPSQSLTNEWHSLNMDWMKEWMDNLISREKQYIKEMWQQEDTLLTSKFTLDPVQLTMNLFFQPSLLGKYKKANPFKIMS